MAMVVLIAALAVTIAQTNIVGVQLATAQSKVPGGLENGANALTEKAIGSLQAIMEKDRLMLQTISNIEKKLYNTRQSVVAHPDVPNMSFRI